jgi:hypothetical protein
MPLCLVSAQAALPNDDTQMLCICYVPDYGPERAETYRSNRKTVSEFFGLFDVCLMHKKYEKY